MEKDAEGEADKDVSAEGLLMEAVGLGVEVDRGETDTESEVEPELLPEGLCEGVNVMELLELVDTLSLLVTT
jgi:hypothetical protein